MLFALDGTYVYISIWGTKIYTKSESLCKEVQNVDQIEYLYKKMDDPIMKPNTSDESPP